LRRLREFGTNAVERKQSVPFGIPDYQARLMLRTIRGTFDFTGRSRGIEVAWWWVGSTIVSASVKFALTWLASEQAGRAGGAACSTLLLLPWFALLVRRLHDQNRAGWWALIFPVTIAINLPRMIASTSVDPTARLAVQPHGLLVAIDLLLILLLFAFSFAPETIGPNRFGPDPREEARPGEEERYAAKLSS
jgi:uncharacterized membrane protein YhaH (DUF805 family)